MKKWLVAAILLYALPLIAQTYEWTDERGTVNFTEDLGKVPPKYRKKAKLIGEESGAPQVTEETEPAKGKGAEGKGKGSEARAEKKVYGGKDEKVWREEFGRANADLKAAEKDEAELRARISDTSRMSRTEYLTIQNSLKHAEFRVQDLKKKLDQLNARADKADLPGDLRQ
ncbi:DUF4124 domain-containing protein [Geomonas sp. RF6]|uniref:DUF4124 domain-containing protein n=1 Tax=Geomonas sp. RF6 TaxID=2897342 RepID=UPI001E578003|nr:DUF4124 domain-containing protein [Geomonas sp. RF6]UFS69673.1 DUF4124 domain-containing protein [Geomonas sp. RF6]